MKRQNGITLVALIITIIVMLILVAVTIIISLGNNGIISKSKEAAMETEKLSIYEVIVSAMKMKEKTGDIDAKGTYDAAKHLLVEKDNKVVIPVSPTSEDQITDGIGMVILDVKGKFGTYTYTITKEKIIIGRGEGEDDKTTISGATSYPYSLRVEPKGENMFTEDEASAIAASSLGIEAESFEEWIVAMANTMPDVSFTEYDEAIAAFTAMYPDADFSTHENVFDFMISQVGEPYTKYNNVYEFALDIYEADEKKLMVNGEEATTGVTWDGNTAIYTIPDGATYNLELILDGKSANNMKASVSGYAGDLEAFGQIFAGKTLNELSQIDDSIYATYGIDKNGVKSFGSSEVESGYGYYFDIYVMTFKYNGNAYGVYAEVVGSDILITRVDLLTEGIKW